MRRGMTLIELVIVVAIMGMIAAIAAPSLNSILGLEQQASIKEMGQTMMWLQEEAALRNVAFRMEINLDRNTWKVEQGDPSSLIFSTPEEAEEFRDEQRAQMRRFTKRQIESGEVDIAEDPSQFGAIEDPRFNTKQTLPEGLQFAFVYTPQYGEDGVEPNNDLPDDPEDEAIAHIHVFPDGTAEHTVIRIVEVDDPDVGYSLEMEPMGGTVRFLNDIIDPRESLSWIPDEGPDFR